MSSGRDKNILIPSEDSSSFGLIIGKHYRRGADSGDVYWQGILLVPVDGQGEL